MSVFHIFINLKWHYDSVVRGVLHIILIYSVILKQSVEYTVCNQCVQPPLIFPK